MYNVVSIYISNHLLQCISFRKKVRKGERCEICIECIEDPQTYFLNVLRL